MIGNCSKRTYPSKCAHELFLEQAVQKPNAAAMICRDRQWTFGETNQLASDVAWRLQDLCFGGEKRVGIYLDHSPETVIAVLGALKAGAAFVPIDPREAPARLNRILDDSGVVAIVTSARYEKSLPDTKAEVLRIELTWSGNTPSRPGDGLHGVELDNAACIIYTSGSTGWPKGVVRSHRGIVSRLAWARPKLDDVQCFNMSLSYGFSQERLLVQLMCGLPLVITGDTQVSDSFVSDLEAGQVTDLTLSPGALRQLLSLGQQKLSHLEKLRTVAVGSAVLSFNVVQEFRRTLPRTKLINAYGATETGSVIRGEVPETWHSDIVPIGRPVSNVGVWVVDDSGDPVDDGVAGEIYLAAPSLARGYLNHPKLTAERFIPNSFDPSFGERLYRTGDRGRIREGQIEFLGRADRQVKIRGFRIELGEVEVALAQHELVREAIVVSAETNGDRHLVAYVAPKPETGSSEQVLRGYLLERLPEYMVPALFVWLSQLPRSLNGKVDVGSLPAPEPSRPETGCVYVAPRNAVESEVAEIWADVLGLDRVGMDDNFLDLGGDSLLATQVISRIRSRFHVEILLASFLQWPTAGELSQWIQAANDVYHTIAMC